MALIEGDIIEIDADTAVGHEQKGRRPALIVSVDVLNASLGLAIVCAITPHEGRASAARNELEVALPPGLGVNGVILPHQIRTIDTKARKAQKIASVPRPTLLATRARLKVLLG